MKHLQALLFIYSIHFAHATEVDLLAQSAQRAMRSDLWDVAALELKEAVSLPQWADDERGDIQMLLAHSLIRSNRAGEALKVLDKASLQAHSEYTFWKGQALAGVGRFGEAAEVLSEVVVGNHHAFREEAAYTAANIYLSLSKQEEALAVLSKIDSVDSKLRQVAIYLDSNQRVEARNAMPMPGQIPKFLSNLADLLEGRLLLAEDEPRKAEPLFTKLLANPDGQNEQSYNLAALGKADAIAAQGEEALAIESLFAYVQSRPESSYLAPIFQRVIDWLPESIPSQDSPIFARLAGWMPKLTPTGNGFINTQAAVAIASWPKPMSEITDLEAFAMYVGAIALQRVNTEAAQAQAMNQLLYLRSFSPRHVFVHPSLLLLAKWKLASGENELAIHILDILREVANAPQVKGEAAFLRANYIHNQGDYSLASELFAEAAQYLDGENQAAASLNAALSRLGQDPNASIQIQNTDPPLTEGLNQDLELERALTLSNSLERENALDDFLKKYPKHPRSGDARIAIAETALIDVPPDLSLAKAQLDTLASAEEKVPFSPSTRYSMARLRLLDLMGDSEASISLANEILPSLTDADFVAQATMILGKNLFRAGKYNEARIALEKLVDTQPDSSRAQAALVLAARSASLGATAQSREEALAIYERAIAKGGALKSITILEKSRLLIDLNRIKQAIELLSHSYEQAAFDDPSRSSMGLLLAEALYAQGDTNPQILAKALLIYDSLLNDISNESETYFRIQYLRGLALEKLPDSKDPSLTRLTEAKAAYFTVIDRPVNPPPSDLHWLELCGFRLISLLESSEDWRAALAIADKISDFGGPRAEEAAARSRQLRLKHMIWED